MLIYLRVDGVVGVSFDLAILLFAGAERGLRASQGQPNSLCERMRATEHAPRGPINVLKRRHGLAEIVERGALVLVSADA